MSIPLRLIILALLVINSQSAKAEIDWHVQLREAHAIATAEGKPLLLHFYADRCVWCEKLEKGAFASPVVEDAIHADFVPVKVHVNTSPSLAKMFKVDKFPSDVVVTPTGKTISHAVSPQDVTRYVDMLKNALSTLETTSIQSEQTEASGIPIAANAGATSEQSTDDGSAGDLSAEAENTESEIIPQATYATLGGAIGSNEPDEALAPEIAPPEYATIEKPNYEPSTENDSTSDEEAIDLSLEQSALAMPTSVLPNDGLANADHSPEPSATSQIALPTAQNPIEENAQSDITMPSAVAVDTEPINDLSTTTIQVNPASAEIPPKNDSSKSPEEDLDLALEGYCAVTVIEEDQWSEGDPALSVIHLGKLYLFADEEKRDRFLSNPVPFTPVLNEIDPVVFFEERRVVPGKREWGMKDPIHQRMFFFADEASMNHFYQEYERYTQSAIDLMDRAVKESNPNN